jgi:Flp pilus assembly protein TadG
MAVFTVVFAAAVFLLAGLVVDGGAAINARLRAADIAEQGARAAADEIDVDRLRETGRIVLRGDADAVCRRAEEIVAAQGEDGARMSGCTAGAAEVTVAVRVPWRAIFLAALGFAGGEMEASATAAPDTGDGGRGAVTRGGAVRRARPGRAGGGPTLGRLRENGEETTSWARHGGPRRTVPGRRRATGGRCGSGPGARPGTCSPGWGR